jgi:hypothetical protein
MPSRLEKLDKIQDRCGGAETFDDMSTRGRCNGALSLLMEMSMAI